MIRTSLILLLALGACAERARDASPSRQEEARPTEAEAGASGGGGELGWAGDEPALAKSAPAPMAPPPPVDGLLDGRMKGESDKAEKKTEGPGGDAEAPTTRSWFPESFLWMPLVQTDASGQAQVEVQVPDSLTTWRVLGLAWSPGGAQAGDVMTVLSTKDAYVDLAVPASLYTGDELELPVQVVNTTDAAGAESWLYEGRASGDSPRATLVGFIDRTDRLLQLIEGFAPEAEWLSDSETLTYLHSCVSTKRHEVRVPDRSARRSECASSRLDR